MTIPKNICQTHKSIDYLILTKKHKILNAISI